MPGSNHISDVGVRIIDINGEEELAFDLGPQGVENLA
jgi:hypothetical protein